MTPPDCFDLPFEALAAIAARHRFRAPPAVPRPWIGATSRVYPLGDIVLKVPFADPAAVDAIRTDAAVAPIARAAGVRTPRLVAFDDARTELPTPYALYARVAGSSLLDLGREPAAVPDAWRELGQDLAIVHALELADGLPPRLRTFAQSREVDPRPWLAELVAAGDLENQAARWLTGLLDRLAPAALAPIPPRFCHGDVNAGNVLIDPASGAYLSVIDWAGAGWLDPIWDFAGVSLAAVPFLLEGHRRQAPLPDDRTAEARILWCHLQLALYHRRQRPPAVAAPDWADRLLANVRRFLDQTGLD